MDEVWYEHWYENRVIIKPKDLIGFVEMRMEIISVTNLLRDIKWTFYEHTCNLKNISKEKHFQKDLIKHFLMVKGKSPFERVKWKHSTKLIANKKLWQILQHPSLTEECIWNVI